MTDPLACRHHYDDLLTIAQLCQRLPQTTPSMVYRWSGCPRYRTGKRNLYMWGEVLAYLRNRPTTPSSGPSKPAPPRGRVHSLPHRSGRRDSLSDATQATFSARPTRPPSQPDSPPDAA